MELIVHRNPEAEARGINPFDHGPLHTDLWKTEGLKQALDEDGFDAAFGGARLDEEKSRATEHVFSFRSAVHRWDPKNRRPEFCNLYNAQGDEVPRTDLCERSPTSPVVVRSNLDTCRSVCLC